MFAETSNDKCQVRGWTNRFQEAGGKHAVDMIQNHNCGYSNFGHGFSPPYKVTHMRGICSLHIVFLP